MVVITALAFIINVGLFVKAKINLQNAVDAGAWAGASVQARQLSNIAYLNWEMRNTYKEYMFKFYVLGQLGIQEQLRNPITTNNRMSFRLKPFFDSTDSSAASLGPEAIDPHNIPSVCIHFGSENNICGIYDVPGIPRFNTVGLPSITPMQESFLNTITQVKASNCSRRSDINFGVAMVWAFGTGSNLFADAPQIAANRVGAWPQALELAARIRNVELLLNQPPIEGGICNGSVSCDQTIEALNAIHVNNQTPQGPTFPVHERSIKAFISAYNNLGGGEFKQSPENQNPLSRNFVLYELPPNEVSVPVRSLSGYLIPPGAVDVKKYYVDLQVWLINMATFYTTFTSTQSTVAGVQGEATCKGSKTALPIPAYPFGYTKNPEVVTYYAVKGETKFVGMFYPFDDTSGIDIAAYGAAKPFGGRIGPKIFSSPDNTAVKARSTTDAMSVPYFSTVEIDDSAGTGFQPGYVIPFTADFWVQSQSDAIGGAPVSGTDAKFVVPNLLYDNTNLSNQLSASTTAAGGTIQMLTDAQNRGGRTIYQNPTEEVGLYDTGQYASFISNLQTASATVMSNDEINASIANVRAPTRYEVANYMIPTLNDYNAGTEYMTPHVVRNMGPSGRPSANGGNIKNYRLFAPLFGPGTHYTTPADFKTVVNDVMNSNESAINSYLEALGNVAQQMIDAGAATRGGAASYAAAAATIHDAPSDRLNPNMTPSDCTKVSMAGKFKIFFHPSSLGGCSITPLSDLISEYITTKASSDTAFTSFYLSTYENHRVGINNDLMTAFFPGPLGSVKTNGEVEKTLSNSAADGVAAVPNSFRNFYSTKFVGIRSLLTNGEGYFDVGTAQGVILNESSNFSTVRSDSIPGSTGFPAGRNFLDTTLIDEFKRSGDFDF